MEGWPLRMSAHIHQSWQAPPAFSGSLGYFSSMIFSFWILCVLFFLVYHFILVDSILRLILESMSQFLPGGLAKYRILSRGSFLLRIFKDISALVSLLLLMYLNLNAVCGLSPRPRAFPFPCHQDCRCSSFCLCSGSSHIHVMGVHCFIQRAMLWLGLFWFVNSLFPYPTSVYDVTSWSPFDSFLADAVERILLRKASWGERLCLASSSSS